MSSEHYKQPMTRREMRKLREQQEQASPSQVQASAETPAVKAVETAAETPAEGSKGSPAETPAHSKKKPEKKLQNKLQNSKGAAEEKTASRPRRAMDTPVDAPSHLSGRIPRIKREQIEALSQQFDPQNAQQGAQKGAPGGETGENQSSGEGNPTTRKARRADAEVTSTGMFVAIQPVPAPKETGPVNSRREARLRRFQAYAEEASGGAVFVPETAAQAHITGPIERPQKREPRRASAPVTSPTPIVSATQPHKTNTDALDALGVNDTAAIEREELQREVQALSREIQELGAQNPTKIDTRILQRQQELAKKMASLRQREAELVVTEEEYRQATGPIQRPQQLQDTAAETEPGTQETPRDDQTSATRASEPQASTEKAVPLQRQRTAAMPTQPSKKDPVGAHTAHGLDSLDSRESTAAERKVMMGSTIVLIFGIILVIIGLIMILS